MIRRPFVLPAGGGEALSGALLLPQGAPPREVVVLVPGFREFSTWGFLPYLAGRLLSRRFAVVTFDFSRNGVGPDRDRITELESFAANTVSREMDELRVVLAALRAGRLHERPFRRVALWGHGRGGSEAVLVTGGKGDNGRGAGSGTSAETGTGAEAGTGAETGTGADIGTDANTGVDALVTWSALANLDRWGDDTRRDWRRSGRVMVLDRSTGRQLPLDLDLLDDVENNPPLDVVGGASGVEVPWLLLHGTHDPAVSTREAKTLAGGTDASRLVLLEGGDHAFGATHPFGGPTEVLRQAALLTGDHLENVLRPAPDQRRDAATS